MNLQQILSSQRERYVQHFLHARRQLSEKEPALVSELLISINNENIPYPYRYLRVDLLYKTIDGEPKPVEVRIDPDPSFSPRVFSFGPLTLEVQPFNWNDIQILFNQAPKDIKQIEGWITHWLDIKDENPENPSGLTGAIHSFTPMESDGKYWRLIGDFGTAPIDALVEFINILGAQGMTRIAIRSDK